MNESGTGAGFYTPAAGWQVEPVERSLHTTATGQEESRGERDSRRDKSGGTRRVSFPELGRDSVSVPVPTLLKRCSLSCGDPEGLPAHRYSHSLALRTCVRVKRMATHCPFCSRSFKKSTRRGMSLLPAVGNKEKERFNHLILPPFSSEEKE